MTCCDFIKGRCVCSPCCIDISPAWMHVKCCWLMRQLLEGKFEPCSFVDLFGLKIYFRGYFLGCFGGDPESHFLVTLPGLLFPWFFVFIKENLKMTKDFLFPPHPQNPWKRQRKHQNNQGNSSSRVYQGNRRKKPRKRRTGFELLLILWAFGGFRGATLSQL